MTAKRVLTAARRDRICAVPLRPLSQPGAADQRSPPEMTKVSPVIQAESADAR